MFIVYRCVKSYGDVFCTEIQEFNTFEEAEESQMKEEDSNPFDDVYFTIDIQ